MNGETLFEDSDRTAWIPAHSRNREPSNAILVLPLYQSALSWHLRMQNKTKKVREAFTSHIFPWLWTQHICFPRVYLWRNFC